MPPKSGQKKDADEAATKAAGPEAVAKAIAEAVAEAVAKAVAKFAAYEAQRDAAIASRNAASNDAEVAKAAKAAKAAKRRREDIQAQAKDIARMHMAKEADRDSVMIGILQIAKWLAQWTNEVMFVTFDGVRACLVALGVRSECAMDDDTVENVLNEHGLCRFQARANDGDVFSFDMSYVEKCMETLRNAMGADLADYALDVSNVDLDGSLKRIPVDDVTDIKDLMQIKHEQVA
jgi:hypothetical protein